MFDIGFFELVVVAVVGLLVLGPEKLPQTLRKIGLYVGRIKQSIASVQQEVNEQLQLEEMRQRLDEHERKVKEGLISAENELNQELDIEPDTSNKSTSSTEVTSSTNKEKSSSEPAN